MQLQQSITDGDVSRSRNDHLLGTLSSQLVNRLAMRIAIGLERVLVCTALFTIAKLTSAVSVPSDHWMLPFHRWGLARDLSLRNRPGRAFPQFERV